MNACVRAVVRAAIYHECKAFCVMEGYEGLVRGGKEYQGNTGKMSEVCLLKVEPLLNRYKWFSENVLPVAVGMPNKD